MRRGNVEERQRGKWCRTRGKRLADTLGLADARRLADGCSFHFVSDLFISIFFFFQNIHRHCNSNMAFYVVYYMKAQSDGLVRHALLRFKGHNMTFKT